jgi:flagellar basal body-associated protein FliL
MADEPDVEVAVDGAVLDSPKNDTNKVVITLIILAVAVMVLTPILTIFAVKTFASHAVEADKIKSVEGAEIKLKTFRVNIAGTKGKRYASIDVCIKVDNAAMLDLFNDQTAENKLGMLNELRANIDAILSSKNLDGFLASDARIKMAAEIESMLNKLLKGKVKEGNVVKVYFPSFLTS